MSVGKYIQRFQIALFQRRDTLRIQYWQQSVENVIITSWITVQFIDGHTRLAMTLFPTSDKIDCRRWKSEKEKTFPYYHVNYGTTACGFEFSFWS